MDICSILAALTTKACLMPYNVSLYICHILLHVWLHAGLAATIAAQSEEVDPADQARQFIQQYKDQYGDRHPRFVEQSWRDATNTAHGQFKFLFAYLHSPEHQVRIG